MSSFNRQGDLLVLARWKEAARKLKIEACALYLAYRDPRTPWYAKVWSGLVAAYAFSPIDLIPDFIPLLGYLDDLVLLPAGVWLAVKLIPAGVMAEARGKAAQLVRRGKPISRAGAAVVVLLWLLALVCVAILIYPLIKR